MFEEATERYFHNRNRESIPFNARDELFQSLERINIYNPPVQTCSTGWTFHGLYAGPTSIAYLFYRLYNIYPDLQFKDQSLIDWAQAYLDLSTHIRKPDPDPSHCGIANETLAQYALRSVMLKDPSLANKVCSYSIFINTPNQIGSNEWLYGRAGYLYFLRLIKSVFTQDTFPSVFKRITLAVNQTTQRIIQTPQPWTWHGEEYLGAAHGTIGIITQLILSDSSTATNLQPLLESLLSQQLPSGNLPSSSSSTDDKLVQFCHGSPGLLLSLTSIAPYFISTTLHPQIQTSTSQARKDIPKRGLLTKEPSLCHGIAGNALSLYPVTKLTSSWIVSDNNDNNDDDNTLQTFLSHMTTSSLEERRQEWMDEAGRNDHFVGLYTGEAGRAWVWAMADQMSNWKGKGKGVCIGYNDL